MMPAGASTGVVQLLASQLASFLALLLAASALHKWSNWGRTRNVVREFAGVPGFAAGAAAAAAGACELSAAVLLFIPSYRAAGACLGALIFALYLALIVRAIVNNRRGVDCGCTFGPARHSLGAFEVWRNASLTAFALLVGVSSANGAAAVMPSQAFGACALLALYAAADQVMGMRPMRRGAVL